MTDSRLILIRQNEKILSLLFTESRLIEMNAWPDPGKSTQARDSVPVLGGIYVGKVMNVAGNIQAAFVELTRGNRAFLSLEHLNGACLLNRKFDGRLAAGDEILVQVAREAVKTKDPVLTTEISLSGRYVVVFPGTGQGKVQYSSKLGQEDRIRLAGALRQEAAASRELSQALEACTVIVRTNAGELTDMAPFFSELCSLSGQALGLLKNAPSRTCYSCLYHPESSWLTEVRDLCPRQLSAILTEDLALYEELRTFLENRYPEDLEKLSLYRDSRLSLSGLYSLTSRIREATETRVWLKSGGYLVIEPTEALTVIDVNSGKYNGRKGTRETFLLINREAAVEIARQLRLRNLSGIILVDFINMEKKEDGDALMELLGKELKKDPVKTVLVDMTPLGLVEITRKKVRRSLKEQLEG